MDTNRLQSQTIEGVCLFDRIVQSCNTNVSIVNRVVMLPVISDNSSNSDESRDATGHRRASCSEDEEEAKPLRNHHHRHRHGLGEPFQGDYLSQNQNDGFERWKWWKVYCLHFMFMWNHRTLEYASVSSMQVCFNTSTYFVQIVLVALAFPKSLTATSLRYLRALT